MGGFFELVFGNFELTVPMGQVYAMLIISMVFIIFGYFKLALTSQILFIFYWLFLDYVNFTQSTKGGHHFETREITIFVAVIIFLVVLITVIKRLNLFGSTR